MEKLDLTTPNFINENIAKLAELFPNCVTEKKNDKGDIDHAIDFDALRQEFADTIVEGQQERYSLNWPGKREALVTANTPISKTLRPCREESVDFDNAKNIFIEGDNLDALKLLQETYLNKIKMIYIDPPYNTGKDFIYKDNFTADKNEYEEASGQRDEEGGRLVTNSDSNGRYHSDWLSMMYPRLKLARNLLKDDGVIFISIADHEIHNLRKICDEIFGEYNFYGTFIWEKKKKPSFLKKSMGTITDYIIVYAKDYNKATEFTVGEVEYGKKYPFNNAGNGLSTLTFPPQSVLFNMLDGSVIEKQDMSEGNIVTRLLDVVVIEDGKNKDAFRLEGEWRYSQEKLQSFVDAEEEIKISKPPFRPNYINTKGGAKKIANFLSKRINNIPTNEDATAELIKLMGGDYMDYPKPTGLIKYLITATTKTDDIILDFFAGSGTTAESVMQENLEGKNHRSILVQLPEYIDLNKATDKNQREKLKKTIEFLSGLNKPTNIAEISKERIRRAGKKIKEELTTKNTKEDLFGKTDKDKFREFSAFRGSNNLDVGFRVFKIDSSNMVDVRLSPDEAKPELFDVLVDNIKTDRSSEDLLFQVLLDWGVDLSLSIEKQEIDGKEVFFVDGNALAACFDKNINEDFVAKLAEQKPLRVVFRDDGFASDSVKINVEQIFKLKSPTTDIKVI